MQNLSIFYTNIGYYLTKLPTKAVMYKIKHMFANGISIIIILRDLSTCEAYYR